MWKNQKNDLWIRTSDIAFEFWSYILFGSDKLGNLPPPSAMRNFKINSITKYENWLRLNVSVGYVEYAYSLSLLRRFVTYAKFSLLNYVPNEPLRSICLRTFTPYAFYTPSCLTGPCVICTFAFYVFTHALYLRTLRALVVLVKTFLGCICSPLKAFHFPVKKQQWNFSNG